MTRVDDTAALWVTGERWGTTPALAAVVTEEERLNFAKAVLCAANGDGQISDAERAWVVGHAMATGTGEEGVGQLRDYDGLGDIEELFATGRNQAVQRCVIWHAVSACGADGDLSAGELEKIHSIAERLAVPSGLVEEYLDIYAQEQALKARRIALTFPQGLPYEVPSGVG
jgi:uncharacterized membrane protein YebE (DUF533 family)